MTRKHLACWLSAGFVGAFFFLYSYPAYEFEARFWILLTPPVLILTAEGIRWMVENPSWRGAVIGCLVTCFTYAAIDYWPHTIVPHYGNDYEQTSPELDAQAHHQVEQPALVLIDSTGAHDFRFSSGFIANDPQLQRGIIYARDGSQERHACLSEAFPDRTLYRFVPGTPWVDGRFERID